MRGILFGLLLVGAFSVALVWAGGYEIGPIVITREDQYKLVLRLSNPVSTLDEPGLSWRIPLLDDVLIFDKRLQYLNAEPVEMPIARGEKLIIDYYAVWRITDPLAFLRNYPGLVPQARERIQATVKAEVGDKLAPLNLREILERGDAASVDDYTGGQLRGTGIEIVDVRLNRIELPRNAEPAAYAQMREQQRAVSREHRAIGQREARGIRAAADRQARLTIADAGATADLVRGEGDAESARIYADAYGKDPEFYAFFRSLEAYRSSLNTRTTMVLRPDHEFFRFLELEGKPRSAPAP